VQPPELALYRTGNSLFVLYHISELSNPLKYVAAFFLKANAKSCLKTCRDDEFALATKMSRTTMKLCQQPWDSKSVLFAARKLEGKLSNAGFAESG